MKKCMTLLAVIAVMGLALASKVEAVVIYQENFDDGTANGFTLSGLWHVTTNYPASGTSALGYVQNETALSGTPDGNYNIGNVTSTVFGPSVAIPSGTTTLTFDAFVGDEFNVQPNSFDQFSVWTSLDGSTLDTVLASSAPSAGGVAIPEWGGVPGYNPIIVDLSTFSGSDIHLAYRFASLDGLFNNYPGVRVDNLLIENVGGDGGGPGPTIPEPGTLLLFSLGTLGAGLIRRRTSQ